MKTLTAQEIIRHLMGTSWNTPADLAGFMGISAKTSDNTLSAMADDVIESVRNNRLAADMRYKDLAVVAFEALAQLRDAVTPEADRRWAEAIARKTEAWRKAKSKKQSIAKTWLKKTPRVGDAI